MTSNYVVVPKRVIDPVGQGQVHGGIPSPFTVTGQVKLTITISTLTSLPLRATKKKPSSLHTHPASNWAEHTPDLFSTREMHSMIKPVANSAASNFWLSYNANNSPQNTGI